MFKTPLRYPGGKTFLAKEFETILETIGLDRPVYVEPYAGGAGAALALLFADKVKRIVINDYDPAIFAFWKAVTERSEWFARKVLSTPVSVEEWKKQKLIYTSQDAEIYTKGFATFFLNRTNRSGVMNAGPIGGMEQGGNYKIDARFNKRELAARVRKIGRFSDRIEVRKEEGLKVTRKFLGMRDTFIYLDPPYFKKGAMLYHRHYNASDHRKLADLLNGNRDKHWLLTYDERSQIRQLYNDRYRKRLPLKYRVRGSRRAYELMIFSDSISN